MTAPPVQQLRQWCAREGGEILFTIIGPQAEIMARAAADVYSGVVAYRDLEGPNADRLWSDWGPWVDAI